MKKAAQELAKKGKDILGEAVYNNFTQKIEKNEVFGKQAIDLHEIIFGAGSRTDQRSKEEVDRILANNQYANSDEDERIKIGQEWKKILILSSPNSFVQFSEETVDILNQMETPREIIDQIHKDIPRTFPSVTYFQNNEVQLSLRKILVSVSNYYADQHEAEENLGYVQGMNLLVGFLLLHFRSEVEVFEFFINMLESKLLVLKRIFKKGLKTLISLVKILQNMIQTGDTELYHHFQSLGINEYIFAYQWILTLFTYSMKFNKIKNLWTLFFSNGWKVFFKSYLILIISFRQKLLNSDYEEVFNILRKAPQNPPKRFIQKIRALKLKEEHIQLIDNVILNDA
eukprot:snap_masked-scaffold_11-processed-gene-6.28-mRNA-1 protein AED:1.00 eAED:1.00 QI:0/0/0/0/1/1/2/0/341